MKVDIRDRGGKGTLSVSYKSLEQLDNLLLRLNGGEPAGGEF
jgi:hypothetical protein